MDRSLVTLCVLTANGAQVWIFIDEAIQYKPTADQEKDHYLPLEMISSLVSGT
jgi:hypothetical protein